MEKKELKSSIAGWLGILLMYVAFFFCGIFLIVISLQVYENIVIANEENFELRTSLSYVATKIRQADTVGQTFMEEKDGVNVLVLGEEIEGEIYQTYIYYMDGYLYELYGEEDMEYELDYGMEVMEIQDFSMEFLTDHLIILTASNYAEDTDTLTVFLRTGRNMDE